MVAQMDDSVIRYDEETGMVKPTPLHDMAGTIHATAANHGFWSPDEELEHCIALLHERALDAPGGDHSILNHCAETLRAYVNRRNFGEMLMLVVTELAEALEAHREGRPAFYLDNGKPEGSAVELMDAVIRLFDTMRGGEVGADLANLNLTLDDVAAIKMQYNDGRPYKHGKEY